MLWYNGTPVAGGRSAVARYMVCAFFLTCCRNTAEKVAAGVHAPGYVRPA